MQNTQSITALTKENNLILMRKWNGYLFEVTFTILIALTQLYAEFFHYKNNNTMSYSTYATLVMVVLCVICISALRIIPDQWNVKIAKLHLSKNVKIQIGNMWIFGIVWSGLRKAIPDFYSDLNDVTKSEFIQRTTADIAKIADEADEMIVNQFTKYLHNKSWCMVLPWLSIYRLIEIKLNVGTFLPFIAGICYTGFVCQVISIAPYLRRILYKKFGLKTLNMLVLPYKEKFRIKSITRMFSNKKHMEKFFYTLLVKEKRLRKYECSVSESVIKTMFTELVGRIPDSRDLKEIEMFEKLYSEDKDIKHAADIIWSLFIAEDYETPSNFCK